MKKYDFMKRNSSGRLWIVMCMLLCIGLVGCEKSQMPIDKVVTEGEQVTKESEIVEDIDPTVVRVGNQAPDFTITIRDGSTFTLSEKRGKVVVLNFWASWCGPCVREMPAFQRLYEEYGDEVQILAIDGLEESARMEDFFENNDYTFPAAYDEEDVVNALYPSEGIPYTVVIDQEGIVRYTYVGASDAETQYGIYKSAIDELLQ